MRRSRKTPVLIVNFWERDAIRQQQLPCRSLLHSAAELKRVRKPCPSTSASKVAQRQVMLMCCNTVAISSNSCWTPSQHLGLPKEPASNIPHASHQAAVGVKRKLCRGAGGRCCAASARLSSFTVVWLLHAGESRRAEEQTPLRYRRHVDGSLPLPSGLNCRKREGDG